MPRLQKRRAIVAFIAVTATTIWMIFATVHLNIYGAGGRSSSEIDNRIDFRIIVLTFNRPTSLLKLLRSIDAMELDGDKAVLEIWVDRSKSGMVDAKTVELAESFNWTGGPTQVHVQKSHAGIRGQWIDTWKPTNDKELVVIVEDDLSLSRYVYRWIKAVHRFYGHREDFAGTALTSDELVSHSVSSPVTQLRAPKNETVFMYRCVGSWGVSPKLSVWRRFQSWYHDHANATHFHPYIDEMRLTSGYKMYERRGTADSVWMQWYNYFAKIEQLYTIYSNLATFVGNRNSCLSINRREKGLHNSRKGRENLCQLLNRWNESFARFPEKITKLDWTGKKVG